MLYVFLHAHKSPMTAHLQNAHKMIENQTIMQFPFIQWTSSKEANTVQLFAFRRSGSYYCAISKIPTLEGLGIGLGRVGERVSYNFLWKTIQWKMIQWKMVQFT